MGLANFLSTGALSNVQRFGPCDPEETKQELFTDRTSVQKYPTTKYQRASYNFTVYANLEYSCVVFRVFHFYQRDVIRDLPYIYLNRWCRASEPICYSFQFLQIDFSVEIWFRESVTYHVSAYGKEVRLVDIKKVTARVNQRKPLVEQKIDVFNEFSVLKNDRRPTYESL
ncbi:hypothetical protein KGM_211724 [Danaus plexippus plexippus]|uniref:Uncharacterized protein n=1 Tax=Danaus plexippus plexippus TaxID=278856 RepID=A0A212EPE0_DANPL|nr:hypothetical protein KGM_211724 [Danaus plexippus plexippus]